jgi:uncharacterized protein (UPF0276 family)
MVDGGPLPPLPEPHPRTLSAVHPRVGLSIGGEGPLDEAHLDRLARLLDRYQPESFSEHLAWSSHGGNFYNDLLPVAYNAATLGARLQSRRPGAGAHQAPHAAGEPGHLRRVRRLDDGRAEFIGEVVRRSGCGLLLDVNNVHVACTNHGRDAREYLTALPLDAVGQIHLAGFAEDVDAAGAPLLIDSHGAPVAEVVWELYCHALDMVGPTPTLIERDNDIPALPVLLAEARHAERILERLLPVAAESAVS